MWSSRFFIRNSRYPEFIHSCPIFSSMKIVKAGTGMEKKGEIVENRTACVSLLSYFSTWVVLSHSLTHIWAISFPSPPRASFMLCCFSFSFSKPQFSLRKFLLHFLAFLSLTNFKGWKSFFSSNFSHFFHSHNNTTTFNQLLITFPPIFTLFYLFVSSFCLSIITFSSLFMHHSIFVGKCQRQIFHIFHTLSLS